MATVIDASIWIDLFHQKVPKAVKLRARHIVDAFDACLCEPIVFEVTRSAPVAQRSRIAQYFATFPQLETPRDLWPAATRLGQECSAMGFSPRPLDLLIVRVCLHHGAELAAFDRDFERIAEHCALKVRLISRPASPKT
jgi:predicted nucleic acid-binding protein